MKKAKLLQRTVVITVCLWDNGNKELWFLAPNELGQKGQPWRY